MPADPLMVRVVDVLATPYLYGLPVENQVPLSKRREGLEFAQALLDLRKKNYPPTHKRGNINYFSTRAFAALVPTGPPIFGVVVWNGRAYDVYEYSKEKRKLVIVERNLNLDGANPQISRKNLINALEKIYLFKNSDILSVVVLVSKNGNVSRRQQLLSNGDIEAN